MEYYKVEKELGNLISDNVKKLESIFPSVVKDGEVDFEELKELLGNFKEIDKEKYELNWVGKKDAERIALEPLYGKTLKYLQGDGKNEDTTENLYIEGDNLEVLKLLQNTYYGQIKMIYIDPPYNRGKDLVYRDNYRLKKKDIELLEENIDEYGNRLVVNKKGDSHFHSLWLSMMYSRLLVAKRLLKPDGVIAISIDDNEFSQLKLLCDQVFGPENIIAQLVWDLGTGTQAGHFTRSHEYILVYSMDKSNLPNFSGGEGIIEDRAVKKISKKNPPSQFTFKAGVKFNSEKDKELVNEWGGSEKIKLISGRMICNDGKLKEDVVLEAGWAMKNQMEDWFNGEETFDSKGQKVLEFFFNENGVLRYKKDRSVVNPATIIKDKGSTKNGTSEVEELLGDLSDGFEYPKPVELIRFLVDLIVGNDDIVLDFFSGSSTTAHAIIDLNAEKDRRIKYIMVQLPELLKETTNAYKSGYKNLCEIGKERIRIAGNKIIEESKDNTLDIGFKVFRVGNSNIKWENMINECNQLKYNLDGVNIDDIDFMPNAKDIDIVYEILLRHYGIPLTAKIDKLDFIGKRTYTIADSIIVCLETKITKEIVDKISELEPIKVIFRDSAFGDDISLKQNSIHRLNVLIEKNNKNTTHVVEFI